MFELRRVAGFTFFLLFCGCCAGLALGQHVGLPSLYPTPPYGGQKERGIDNSGLVPSSLASADFNFDGLPDMAVSYAFGDAVRWFRAQPGGQFIFGEQFEVGTRAGAANDGPRQLLAGDFDQDGFTDLLVICSGLPVESGYPAGMLNAPSVGMLYGRPGGFEPFMPLLSFAGPVASAPRFAVRGTLGLLDANDTPDLAVGFAYSKQFAVTLDEYPRLRQFGTPRIFNVNTSGKGPYSVLACDLRKEGESDLILVNEKDIQIWMNDHDGEFENSRTIAVGQGFTAGVLADFDQDGAWDLAVTDGVAHQVRLLMDLNAAGIPAQERQINLAPGSAPVDLRKGDADLDGRDDLIVVNQGTDSGIVWLNRPAAPNGFVFGQMLAGSRQPRAAELVDLNRDYKPDFALANEGDVNQDPTPSEDVTFTSNSVPVRPGYRLRAQAPESPGALLPPYLDRPTGLAWDEMRGGLWTIDRRAGRACLLDTSHTVLTSFPVNRLVAPVFDPMAVTVEPSGNLWLLDAATRRLVRVNAQGQVIGGFQVPNTLLRPAGLAFDAGRNRLMISSQTEPQLYFYSPTGQALGTIPFDEPLLQIAWHAATQTLWGVSAMRAGQLRQVPMSSMTLDPPDTNPGLDLHSVAPLLGNARLLGVAVHGGAPIVEGLESGGMLMRFAAGSPPRLIDVHEWCLLRNLKAAAHLTSGGLLLADSGLLATLVRLDRERQPVAQLSLNRLENDHPIAIRGLAAGLGYYFVLDGNNRRVQVVRPDGSIVNEFGNSQIRNRHPQGLRFDPATNRLTVGIEGRLLTFQLTPKSGNSGVNAMFINEAQLPANVVPGSVGGGTLPGDAGWYAAGAPTIPVMNAQGMISGWVNSVQNVPATFKAVSALMPEGGKPGYLTGAGSATLISFALDSPSASALDWTAYE